MRLKLPSLCSEEPFEVKKARTFPDEGYIYGSHVSANTLFIIRTIHSIQHKEKSREEMLVRSFMGYLEFPSHTHVYKNVPFKFPLI